MDISKRDKKVLMIGALAVALFLVINYVISPFIESENDIQGGTEQKEMLLQKYERVINQRGEIEKKLAKMKRDQSDLNKKLLKGSTPTLAAAEMQKML